ncbi:MAG: SDR family oxidoreductase [bacterium]
MAKNTTGDFYRELFALEGKVAVITGGTGVLCGAMGGTLHNAGCRIVLVGRKEEKANAHFAQWKSSPETARFLKADVTEKHDLERIIPAVLDWFGAVNVWINGAGVNSPTPYLEIADDEFNHIVSTNVLAVHRACQAIGAHWIKYKSKGSIINVTSMSAVRPLSRVFTYSLSKAAVLNLTQNLAREWAPLGIRVNALCPGFFPAEQNLRFMTEERAAAIKAHTPMSRFGNADELAGATLLLASESAGSFITGLNLIVDGGFSVTSI